MDEEKKPSGLLLIVLMLLFGMSVYMIYLGVIPFIYGDKPANTQIASLAFGIFFMAVSVSAFLFFYSKLLDHLFILFLGVVFMFLGFVVPLLVDCGLGSIGLFIFGLVGFYLFFTTILDCFGEKGQNLHASIDEKIRIVLDVLLGNNEFSEAVYYDISIIGSILIGGFFTLWAIGLGWLAIWTLRNLYIRECLIVSILFAHAFYFGPIKLYKGLRELFARVKRYIDQINNPEQ